MFDIKPTARFEGLLHAMLLKDSKDEKLTKTLPYLINQDHKGYRRAFPVCPHCDNLYNIDVPIYHTKKFDVFFGGKIDCLCAVMEYMADKNQKWNESFRNPRWKLNQIVPIDVPEGAAKQTKEILSRIVDYFRNPAQWLLLSGGTGTAKSHILVALKNYYGSYATFITASDFTQKLITFTYKKLADELIESYITTPILILDDFGMEHKSASGYNIDILAHIVDQRYARGALAPVWTATNLTKDEMRINPDDNIMRFASRLLDSSLSNICNFIQDDYRLAETKKAAGLVK